MTAGWGYQTLGQGSCNDPFICSWQLMSPSIICCFGVFFPPYPCLKYCAELQSLVWLSIVQIYLQAWEVLYDFFKFKICDSPSLLQLWQHGHENQLTVFSEYWHKVHDLLSVWLSSVTLIWVNYPSLCELICLASASFTGVSLKIGLKNLNK